MASQMFNPGQVAEALHKTRGNQTAAARILGCTRVTVHNYVKRYPECAAAVEEGREMRVDLAEAALDHYLKFERDEEGNVVKPPEWRYVKWVLMTLGKERGWTWHQMDRERTTTVIERERTLVIERIRELPEDERQALRKQLFKARELALTDGRGGDVIDGEFAESEGGEEQS